MRTSSNATGAAARMPCAVHDSASPLELKKRKTGANIFPSAPIPAPLSDPDALPVHEQAVIDAALTILRARMRKPGESVATAEAARCMAMIHFAGYQIEGFAVMFLDAGLRLIAFEDVSRGTLTQTCVYPREIVRAAMRHNAAAVILTHNHPSGDAEPSDNDLSLTKGLKDALRLVDVTTLDHLVIAGDRVTSFAERGLL